MATKGLGSAIKEANSGTPYFKLKDGEQATIRFLSSPDEFIGIRQHTIEKSGGKFETTWCSEQPDCPVCLAGNRASYRVIGTIVERGAKQGEKDTVKVFNMSKKTANAVALLIEEYNNINDRDFKVKVTGTKSETTYHFFPKDKSEDKTEYENVPDLDTYCEVNLDKLRVLGAMLGGGDVEEAPKKDKDSDYPF